ncbi:unnamed protein product [Thlaspi arvense]|uniref:Serine/threonine-protein phosphatase n=1 Tax=Thlaspi arvense TaxID=13288 RepID=A0AAU9RJ86_THLAR|nr:unnamed protein product [Thlaspi arvense]
MAFSRSWSWQYPSTSYKVQQTVFSTPEDRPGPRCGHTLTTVLQSLILFGGSSAVKCDASGITLEGLTNSVHCYTLFTRRWTRVYPDGLPPSPRACHAATSSGPNMVAILGGIGTSGACTDDLYILNMTSNRFMWQRVTVQGATPGPRYGHFMGLANHRLVVSGGKNGHENLTDKWALDTIRKPNVWERLNPSVNLPSAIMNVSAGMYTLSASASVSNRIYIYGGVKEGVLLEDLLVSIDGIYMPSSSGPASPSLMRSSSESSLNSFAEVAANLPTVEAAFYDSATEAPAPPQQEAVARSDLDDLVREPSLDWLLGPELTRSQESTQDLVKRVISTLLRPNSWEAPASRKFFLSSSEVIDLCSAAEDIIKEEPSLLQLNAPIKIFGDIHGQFGDLMRLFYEYGSPSTNEGDISYIDYLFLGDYVDRGKHSLEIEYPKNIHLLRGNHESRTTNKMYGFKAECMERMGDSEGKKARKKINILFNHLPLAALIEKKILCMHGGIGEHVKTLEDIANIRRPVYPDSISASRVVKDLLWSDPTENDSVLGIRANTRGKGVVSFGPDVVKDFCERNKVDMIIRAHQCVLDGFERFAQGQLITVFSAPYYCGKINNAGAILVIGRDLMVVPKLIHPLPPPISPSENSLDNAWVELESERPPTPVRGQRNTAFEEGSTS